MAGNPFDQFHPETNAFDQFENPQDLNNASAYGRTIAGAANAGIADLAGMPMDTAANLVDLGIAGYGTAVTAAGHPELAPANVDRAHTFGTSAWIQDQLNKVGIQTTPTDPSSPIQRVLYTGVRGGTSSLVGGDATPLSLAANAVRGGAGAIAGQEVQRATGSPTAGIFANLVTNQAPELMAAGVRGVMRGADPQTMQQNVNDFERAGTAPSVGQATQSPFWQAIESLFSRAPGGAHAMEKAADRQQESIGQNVIAVADQLSPNASATKAGFAIKEGITGNNGFYQNFEERSNNLYGAVDNMIPGQTPVPLQNTLATLDRLTTPTPGAKNVSGALSNSWIASLRDAVRADISAPNSSLPEGISPGATPEQLPYESVRALRTAIGAKLKEGLVSDVPNAQLKQLYGALSDDLRTTANAQGPAVAKAYKQADDYYSAGIDRLEKLTDIANKGDPERIFQSALSGTKEGATTLNTVMKSIPGQNQQAVTAAVLRRMGRAAPGNQNDLGETFSTQTFLTNWNRMSPEAKQVLFNRYGPTFRNDMNRIASVANNLKEGSQVFANPSGTTQASHLKETMGAVAGAAALGHLHAAGAVLGGVAATNLGARAMTNPNFVRWLATNTTKPVSSLNTELANLATFANRSRDSDLLDITQKLNAYLGKNSEQEPANQGQ